MELTPFLFGLYKLLKYAVYPLTWVWVLLGCATVMVMLAPASQLIRWARAALGVSLGLSRERVRQIEARALEKLRRSQRVHQLMGYLN